MVARRFLALAACLLAGCTRSGPESARGSPSPRARAPAVKSDLARLNESAPGQSLDLASHLVPARTTLFEFYSQRCRHSDEMAPVMRYLAANRADLAIRQVDIDRPDATEIDFDSPLAEQYAVHATPAFRIYDASGSLIAEGSAAKDEVRRWYQEAQLRERAEQMPGVAEPYRKPD